jgi:hypothetical protein
MSGRQHGLRPGRSLLPCRKGLLPHWELAFLCPDRLYVLRQHGVRRKPDLLPHRHQPILHREDQYLLRVDVLSGRTKMLHNRIESVLCAYGEHLLRRHILCAGTSMLQRALLRCGPDLQERTLSRVQFSAGSLTLCDPGARIEPTGSLDNRPDCGLIR